MRKNRRRLFQIFSTQGQSDFLAASTLRWERRSDEKERRKEEYEEHMTMWATQEECQELRNVIKYMIGRKEELFENEGTKEEFVKRSTGRLSKAFGDEQNLEEMMKERRNAKAEEGKEKVIAQSDVTRRAASGISNF